jgi:hypothetical protein
MADDKMKSEDMVPQADKQAHYRYRTARGQGGGSGQGYQRQGHQQGTGGEEETLSSKPG